MRYFIPSGEDFQPIDIQEKNGFLNIDFRGKHYQLDIEKIDDKLFSAIHEGRVFKFIGSQKENEVTLLLNHLVHKVTILNQRQKMELELFGVNTAEGDPGDVKAPMPGMILRLEIETGQEVAAGDPLLVIEAMKMENEIRAPKAGKVSQVFCNEEQAVERDDLLIRID